ncbi:MAG: hypothetical protein OER88_01240 [Planctomycetota bacterium]|nr:hypothetical protein [Planctomycetota bacterium]
MIIGSAPTRVDLAGGTIDVWPVCFSLEAPAVTVNLAINLCAHVTVEETHDGVIHVRSEDRDEEVSLPVDALTHDRLGLVTRHVAHFGAGDGLRIVTHSGVPPQSGLGGSSTLGVALAGALGKLRGHAYTLRTIQDIETALLRVPTGYQDYVPPLHGGCNVIEPTPGGLSIEPIAGAGTFLRRHLVLVDTSISHHSGMNNWEVVKRFLDGDADVVRGMNAIRACAAAMADALRAGDLAATAEALRGEWSARRHLAPVVSNDRIESILGAAEGAGALAGKVCGAGGGGCLILLAHDAQDEAIVRAVENAGGSVLAFEPDNDGLRVDYGPLNAPVE